MDDLEILPDGSGVLGSARTSAHRSTPKQRVEIITRGARRKWRPEEKREIVLASLAPGAMASAVCRLHGIGSGQLSVWREQFRDGKLGPRSPLVLNFAEAVARAAPTLPPSDEPLPADRSRVPAAPRPGRQRSAQFRDDEVIEIALPNGMVVRVGGAVDQAALGRVLAALKSA
jgi:transposase